MAAVIAAIHALAASFTAVPSPTRSPARTVFAPIASRTGCTRSSTSAGPAASIVSFPCSAGPFVPSIIASTRVTPDSSASRTTVSVPEVPIVDACTHTASRGAALPAARSTSTTASVSKSVSNTTSASATALGASCATVAPSDASGAARSALRFHTVTSWPSRRSDRATPAPIVPVPSTVTRTSSLRPVTAPCRHPADRTRRVRGSTGRTRDARGHG